MVKPYLSAAANASFKIGVSPSTTKIIFGNLLLVFFSINLKITRMTKADRVAIIASTTNPNPQAKPIPPQLQR